MVTPEELTKGVMVRIAGAGGHTTPRRNPYCLLLVRPPEISKETGALTLTGEVRAVDGTTTRKNKLFRTTVQFPKNLEVVR